VLGSWLQNQASAGGGSIPRIQKRSAADEDRDEGDTQGELGQASSAHDSSFCVPSPAPSQPWAGMGGFGVDHPVYSTNEGKSQEGDTKITYRSALGFLSTKPATHKKLKCPGAGVRNRDVASFPCFQLK
jgi:hypothetical protein